jgi:hypothetical protein
MLSQSHGKGRSSSARERPVTAAGSSPSISPPGPFRNVTRCRESVVSSPDDIDAMTFPYRCWSFESAFCRRASSSRADRSFSERYATMNATPRNPTTVIARLYRTRGPVHSESAAKGGTGNRP